MRFVVVFWASQFHVQHWRNTSHFDFEDDYRSGCRMSVTVNNSPIQDYVHPNDHILNRTWSDSWSDDRSLRSRRLEVVNAGKNGRASLTRVPVLSCALLPTATATGNTSVFACAFASGFTWPISCQNLWTQLNLFLITYFSYVYFFLSTLLNL